MAPHEPNEPDKEAMDMDLEKMFSDDSEDDLLISKSLQTLPAVEVPSGFLPGVMFQVYEYHHREKIHLPSVLGIALVLLVMALSLFAWDVADYAGEQQLDSYGAALDWKLDQAREGSSEIVSAASGILTTSWTMVSGAGRMFFKDTPITIQLIIFAGLLAIAFLARKYLGRE